MKITLKIALFIALLASLLPGAALASGLADRYIWGDSFTLESGETIDEDLYIMGGNVILEEGSLVDGDVLLAGGNLTVDGEVTGNVMATGGNVHLGSSAVVQGDVNLVGATLRRDQGASVEGQVDDGFPGTVQINPGRMNLPWRAMAAFNPFGRIISIFLWSFLLSAVAVVGVMFWPRQVERTGATAVVQPVISGSLGLLTIIVGVLVLVILTLTIIMIPVSFLGLILLALLAAFGWISLGYELGRRMMHAFKTEWAMPVSAGLGTLLLTLVASSIDAALDCIGWTVPFLIVIIGLGAVLITRLGTQPYPIIGSAGTSASFPPAPAPVTPLVVPVIPREPEGMVPSEIPPEYMDEPPAPSGAEVFSPGEPPDEIPPAS